MFSSYKKVLGNVISLVSLSYAIFYLNNGLSSGDHWKFVETFFGLFVFFISLYWTLNLDKPPATQKAVRRNIKRVIIALAALLLVLFIAFNILLGLAFQNG